MSSTNNKGLAFCGSDFNNSFCICKLIQVMASFILLTIILYDLIIRYKIERQINFFVVLCTFMVLALISNIIFSFDHELNAFDDLQGYFYSVYFTIIVYHIALKLFVKKEAFPHQKIVKWIIHGTFLIYNILIFAILIQDFVTQYVRCQEIWYIVVDGIGVIFSIILVVVGIIHTKKQREKLKGLKNPQHYKNPLFSVWIWILVNIFSQVCAFTESLVFELNPQDKCSFVSNQSLDVIIKFIFAMLSFHLGILSTIVFFRRKYNKAVKKNEGDILERTRKQSINIQLAELTDN